MNAATRRQFAKEYDFVSNLFIGHMKVAYPWQLVFKLIQLMVMCSKQRFRFMLTVMKIFRNAPGDRNAVVSAGSAANLIKYYQAAWRNVIDDTCRFIHLNH